MRASNYMRVAALLLISWVGTGCRRSGPAAEASAVPPRVLAEHPCPATVPSSWIAADPGLGRGPRCSLVAAAASTIRAAVDHDPQLRAIDLVRVSCVHLERITLHSERRDSMVAHGWLVVFSSATQPDVAVSIRAPTGDASAFLSPRDDGRTTQQVCAPAT